MNAFFIQDEIDKSLDLLYPISQFLMRFMVKADSDFLQQYLAKIERECMLDGKRHELSFVANLIPILEMNWNNFLRYLSIKPQFEMIIKHLITMDVSDKLFRSSSNFQILRI